MKENYLKKELFDLVKINDDIFNFLKDGILDGLWYLDVENPGGEWMCPNFKKTFGYEDHEIENNTNWWQENIHPEDLPIALENFSKHCDDKNHKYDQVVRYYHKNGSIVWIRCRGIGIRDEGGKVIRMLGAHIDLTELKIREENLLRNQQDKIAGKLAAGISHEVNNKLTIMALQIKLLLNKHDDETLRKELNSILAKIHSSTSLTNKLLVFSGDAGAINLNLNLNTFFTTTIPFIQGIMTKEVEIVNEVSSEKIYIDFDPYKLEYICFNLALNAKEAMVPGRSAVIRIHTKTELISPKHPARCKGLDCGNYAVIEFMDNGGGIKSEDLLEVKNPFFTTKDQNKHEGLGLSMANSVLNKLNSVLIVESVENEFTKVILYIPTV
jgi:PAS domain S-box-containing protein